MSLLHWDVRVKGSRYRLRLNAGPDGSLRRRTTVTVVNFSLVNVNEMASVIWTEKAHRRAIHSKSEKAREDGLYPFVEVTKLAEQLAKWCHRSDAAKSALEAFDFAVLANRMREDERKYLSKQAEDHLEKSEEHLAKRRRLLERVAELQS